MIDGQFILTRDIKKPIPVAEYLASQRRFRHLKEEDIAYIQEKVDAEYERLKAFCEATKPAE